MMEKFTLKDSKIESTMSNDLKQVFAEMNFKNI